MSFHYIVNTPQVLSSHHLRQSMFEAGNFSELVRLEVLTVLYMKIAGDGDSCVIWNVVTLLQNYTASYLRWRQSLQWVAISRGFFFFFLQIHLTENQLGLHPRSPTFNKIAVNRIEFLLLFWRPNVQISVQIWGWGFIQSLQAVAGITPQIGLRPLPFIWCLNYSSFRPDMGLGLYSVPPGSGLNNSSNWATTTSFHMVSKLFIVQARYGVGALFSPSRQWLE